MKKIPTPYLEDILESINIIEQYLAEIDNDKSVFEQELQVQDSVIRRLEIIGEATKRLEENFRQMYTNVPWRKMAGMRDVLIHDYDEIDLDLVWNVITEDLPELKRSIEDLLGSAE